MFEEQKPDFKKEFKRQIENKENMMTGYENLPDVDLLNKLNETRENINKIKDPLNPNNISGIGNLADLETEYNILKGIEMEIQKRSLLN